MRRNVKLYLTHVGSFPLENTGSNLVECTRDILSIPIDYPNHIQLEDFQQQFLEPLAALDIGLVKEGGEFRLEGELRQPPEPVATEPLQILLDMVRGGEYEGKVAGVKACVTGPFTLSSKIKSGRLRGGVMGDTILPDIALVGQVAEVVGYIGAHYREMGATYVGLDEPVLSILVGGKFLFKEYSDEAVVEVINRVARRLDCLKGIHVCGRLSPKLAEILLQTEVDILDHEFADEPSNLRVYSRRDLERCKKKIAYGAVSSRSMRVETPEEITEGLKRGFEAFGEENLFFVKPDCGFMALGPRGSRGDEAYQAAISKLKNLSAVLEILRSTG